MEWQPDTLLANIAYRLDYPHDRELRVKRNLYWFSVTLIGLIALLSVVSRFVQTGRNAGVYWINPFTHSLFESYGGLISLTIGYVLYREYRESGKRSTYYLLMAFLSMAVFDFSHAYSNHSLSLFIWFHTLSAFSGGYLFLWSAFSVRKPAPDSRRMRRMLLTAGAVLLAVAVAETVHLQPVLPEPLADELSELKHLMPVTLPSFWDFSETMILVNALSSLCYVAAGVRFLRYFAGTSDLVFFVFSLASFLFGESEMLFAFSGLWNITWWYWHAIKLLIFIGLSIGLAHALTRTFRELYESRRQLRATVDELKFAYDHLKSTQEELLASERLASIGKMAATISHEIRNPLAAIKNSAGIFERHARLSPEDSELLSIIGREIQRLDNIITDFLEFAKPHPLRKTLTDLNALIEETIVLVENSDKMDGRIRVLRSFDPRLPAVRIDENVMKQVLWNVLINAVQAMPAGGELTAATSVERPGPDGRTIGAVTIDIADTGCGMSAETAKKAFQPFFSTKSRGTGLGLAIVERAIRQHGGNVSLHSVNGRGTTVKISIPVNAGQTTTAEAVNDVVHFDR